MPDNEGVIKFNCQWKPEKIVIDDLFLSELNTNRRLLLEHHLIGRDNDGNSYGNISIRMPTGVFLVTGSSTGHLIELKAENLSEVVDYSFYKNTLSCRGLTRASSESLSHAAVFETLDHINVVIHVHQKEKWETYFDLLPTTSILAAYGTPEIAFEIQRLLKDKINVQKGILVMGGHNEGFLAFGETLKETTALVLNYLK